MRDEAVLAAIRRGDGAVMDQVMSHYARLLWRVAGNVLRDAEQDLEECVADVFIELWQHPEKCDLDRGNLKTWLYLLARSKALDRYRARQRHWEDVLDENATIDRMDVCDTVLKSDARQMLLAAIQDLDMSDRELLYMRYWEDMKPKVIAKALDLPVKTVENRLYRIRQKLRTQLEGVLE